MVDPTLFQTLIGSVGDFVGWSHRALTNSATRRAIIADLGGMAGADGADGANAAYGASSADDPDGGAKRPAPAVGNINAYRDAAEPDLEGLLAALQDVRAAIDSLRGLVQSWDLGADAVADESLRTLLDLLATNYMRLHQPQIHYFMQLVSFAEETASLYGSGRGTGERFPSAVRGLLEFLLGPLSTWNLRLADEADAERQSNRSLRLLGALCAFIASLHIDDTLYGLDLPPPHHDNPQADQPTAADAVLGRMLSLQFGPAHNAGRIAHSEQARLSMAWVPRSHAQPALYLGLGGVFHLAAQLGKRWHVTTDLAGAGVLNAMFGKGLFKVEAADINGGDNADLQASVAFEARPDATTGLSYDLSPFRGASLQVGLIRLEAGLRRSDAQVKATFRNGALRLSPEAVDGFLASLLPADGLRLPFDFALGHSSERGRIFEGQVPFADPRPAPAGLNAPAAPALPPLPLPASDLPGFDVSIPIGRALGPLKLHTLRLGLGREGDGAQRRFVLVLSTSISSTLGPVTARVEGLGLRLALAAPPGTASNLGLLDLDVGVRTPDGVALAIDARGLVTGGGFIQHDRTQGSYAGVMELTLRRRLTLKAFGLLNTRLPVGRRGYSLIVFITADGFNRWPLGMGFWLLGVGGMLALHRTVDAAALREGMKTGLLADLLFPRDPVRRAPEILRSLASTFPVREGSHIVGVLARIGWGTPLVLWMDLALMVEFGNGTSERLVVLGRISSILPSRENDLLRLNMDAVGVVDFDAGRVELDAMLVDSRFAQRFVLTGAMALRLRWAEGTAANGANSGFLLAVGGWNPHFAPPVATPRLERVAIQLASGNNPRITCEAYFAITSNTLQFGSRASLYAEAHGFSIAGDIGFDVLIQLQPFHFLAEFHAAIQLRRGSRNLFKVTVAGALEGPRPLRVRAKASFEIFWCDFSVHFDRTLVAGRPPLPPPAVDGLALLAKALAEPQRWQALLPDGEREMVVLRPRPASAPLALHPLGRLRVTQTVLPLNTARDIDVFGGAPLAGARRFALGKATLNGVATALQPLREQFAPGQFFDMDDEQRIASPSFEMMDAGVVFGDDTLLWPATDVVQTALAYEQLGIDDTGAALPPDAPYPLSPQRLSQLATAGAVAKAVVRAGTAQQRAQVPETSR